MKHSFFKLTPGHCLLSVALCLASALAQAQTMPATTPSSGMPKAAMSGGTPGGGDMKSAMTSGMDAMQKMPMSGDTDKDFAMMMKVHHQQALGMAQIELTQGKSSEMKMMAKNIISAQKKEIAAFDRWLAKQK